MKKSMLLFETLVSFFILSVVILFSSILYTQLLNTHKTKFNTILVENDLTATKLFMAKQLKEGVVIELFPQKIAFYALDTPAFLQGFYSGIIDLNQSSSQKVFTPSSQTQKLTSSYLLFKNTLLHELLPQCENGFLCFKNPLSKTIYEHYSMEKNISTFYVKEEKLYFNDTLLQDNITSFNAQKLNEKVHVDVCIQTRCQEWIF
jgi:hypothetical protein